MFQVLSVLVVLLLAVEGTAAPPKGCAPRLVDTRILLPPKMTHEVEYRLQGTNGCFQWSWDHHDILTVIPQYTSSNKCSASARLKSIGLYSGRKETTIHAADVSTGIVSHCKVVIDNFSKIKIIGSPDILLHEHKTLLVRAFDKEDHVFSSLVGLQFMWKLMPETDGLPNHLLHLPLKDAPKRGCGGLEDIQINLEDNGVYSDRYLVKAIGVGREIVSVHLYEEHFKDMAAEIVLTVAEALLLHPPSPVFVLIGAEFQYSLKVIRENIPQVITLPSPHHQWSVLNLSVAKVDAKLGLTHALTLGVTTVIVEDTRVNGHRQFASHQISKLHVVIPDTIILYLSRLSSSGDLVEGTKAVPSMPYWYVVVGYKYLIQIKIFSQGPGPQYIHLTEHDDVKMYVHNAPHLEVEVSGDIATKHGWQKSKTLKADSEGLGNLIASLTYFTGQNKIKKVLEVEQKILVCRAVKFSMGETNSSSRGILLPWVPFGYQEIELKATGGCATSANGYRWFSSDIDTIYVSSGVVRAKKPGKATVKVESIFDVLNYDEVVIEVSAPSSMVMLPNLPVEAALGSHLIAAVAMKASNGDYFYRCDALNSFVKWKSGSQSFLIVNAARETNVFDGLGNSELSAPIYGPPSPCSWAYAYASSPGRTTLNAKFSEDYHQLDHSFQPHTVLEASSHIAAYVPLQVCRTREGSCFGGYRSNLPQRPDSQLEKLDKIYLALGSNLEVMLRGGPGQWGKGIGFNQTVEIQGEDQIHAKDGIDVHHRSGDSYEVSCKMLGNYILIFKRGNLVGQGHPLLPEAEAEATFLVVCSIPSTITVLADGRANQHDVEAPIAVANGRSIQIVAVPISDSGEAFADSSSLSIGWELKNCDGLASWVDANVSEKPESSWERILVLHNEPGMCMVCATVAGFSDTTGDTYSTQLLKSSDGNLTVRGAIRLQLVSPLRVDPKFNLLFFNPAAKIHLPIIGGSCSMVAKVDDSRVVEVLQSPPGLNCSQLIVSPKGLGTTTVTIQDVGVSPPHAADTVVQVADMDWIKITSPEEISLVEGTTQFIDLIAGINSGSTFEASQYPYMNIHVHTEDEIIGLVHGDGTSRPGDGHINTPRFKIVARTLGITTVYVSARHQSRHAILSERIKVGVYATPRIHPRNIFLAPGASYTLMLKGCPTIAKYVEFASKDNGIATIDKSSGRLSAGSPGKTTLTATVYGNEDNVICQVHGSLEVGIPSSMRLDVQSKLPLPIGCEMPIYPSFPEGNLFSFYELCRDYKWSIEDEKVLRFQVMKHFIGDKKGDLITLKETKASIYLYEKEHGFINVVSGRSAGTSKITVSFSCDFISGSSPHPKSYTASVSLPVIRDVSSPFTNIVTWVLPPYYTTSSILPSSSESYGMGDNDKGAISYSFMGCENEENGCACKGAVCIDGDRIKTTTTTEGDNIAYLKAKKPISGDWNVISSIRVAEVSQIRIATKKLSLRVIHLAVGAGIDLPVNYYDDLGNPFHEVYNVAPIYVETNFPDIVSINNDRGKISLKAIRYGRALVRVSMSNANNPLKSYYLLVSVGAHINPENPVVRVGSDLSFTIEGYLNFDNEGLNDQVSTCWASNDESILSVHTVSGKARAVGEGTTQVLFESSSIKLQTTVTVVMDRIIVNAPKEKLTNVPFPKRGYNFPVKLSGYDSKIDDLGNDKGIPFDCRVEPSYVGYVVPWMELDSGNLCCLFFPYSPELLVHSHGLKDMKPDISVSVTASLRKDNQVSGSASAHFIGGFYILEMSQETMMLSLTPDSNKTSITVVGNTGVQVQVHRQDLIKVNLTKKEDFGIAGRMVYEVEVLKNVRFSEKVIFELPANGQRVEVDVNFPERRGPPLWPASGLFLILLVVCIYYAFGYLFPKNNVPMLFA